MGSFHPSSRSSKGQPNSSTDNTFLSSSPHITVEPEYPEGGIKAWCTVFGAFLGLFCGYGYTNAFGIYQAFYTQQYLQNESSSAVSWIGSLGSFIATGMGPICGQLFDNGYFYHVYTAGAVLQSLSIFMLSLVQPGQYYQILLVQGVMSGIGQGLLYVPSFAIISHHFKRRRTAMMSIVASGSALGGVANTILLNKLLDGPVGFKTGVKISATVMTMLLFLSCVLVRTRYHAVRREATSVKFWKAAKKCFTEVPSLLTIIGLTLFQIAYLYPVFYFQVDSLKHGLSPSFAFYSLVIINAGCFFGRFGAGAALRFVGVIDLTIITTVACAILIIGMIWLGSVASVVVLGILYGVISGMNIGVMAPMMGLTADPAELGIRLGIGFATAGIGGLVGSPICGALLTDRYLWWAPGVFCGVIALMAAVLFVAVRFTFTRGCISAAGRNDKGDPREGDTRPGIEIEKNEAEVKA